jgi:KDO2-lipid IV(A) lauroyltransferase
VAAYAAVRLLAWAARLLPLVLSYGLARAGGVLAYYAWVGGRRRCVGNMLHVTGGDQRAAQRLARRSFAHYGAYLVDFLRLIGASPEDVQRRVIFDDWERIAAERTGNGIVFVTAHYGLWDLGAVALAAHGFPVTTIADRFANRRLDRLILGSRERLGLSIVPADRVGPRVLRALKRDQVIALLVDIPFPETGVQVEFFGERVAVTDAFARLALRAGAPVVATTTPRLGRWSERVRCRVERVAFEPTGDAERDVRELTQATFRTLEAQIRDDPAQWYIFRRLWLEPAAEPTGSAA